MKIGQNDEFSDVELFEIKQNGSPLQSLPFEVQKKIISKLANPLDLESGKEIANFSGVSRLTYGLSNAPELAQRVEDAKTVARLKAEASSVSSMYYDFPGESGTVFSY